LKLKKKKERLEKKERKRMHRDKMKEQALRAIQSTQSVEDWKKRKEKEIRELRKITQSVTRSSSLNSSSRNLIYPTGYIPVRSFNTPPTIRIPSQERISVKLDNSSKKQKERFGKVEAQTPIYDNKYSVSQPQKTYERWLKEKLKQRKEEREIEEQTRRNEFLQDAIVREERIRRLERNMEMKKRVDIGQAQRPKSAPAKKVKDTNNNSEYSFERSILASPRPELQGADEEPCMKLDLKAIESKDKRDDELVIDVSDEKVMSPLLVMEQDSLDAVVLSSASSSASSSAASTPRMDSSRPMDEEASKKIEETSYGLKVEGDAREDVEVLVKKLQIPSTIAGEELIKELDKVQLTSLVS